MSYNKHKIFSDLNILSNFDCKVFYVNSPNNDSIKIYFDDNNEPLYFTKNKNHSDSPLSNDEIYPYCGDIYSFISSIKSA